MFYVSYFMKCKTGNHCAAIMTWKTIYPMVFYTTNQRNACHHLTEALLWVIAKSAMSERNISYTPMGDIATSDSKHSDD